MDGVKIRLHSFLTSALDRREYMCFRPKVKQNFGPAAMLIQIHNIQHKTEGDHCIWKPTDRLYIGSLY